ncbi:hypothetical protein AALP_AA8G352400 [Arabis alpina]|uniref:FBD domain-containing protein n=1 Tax=Arabis alpina TaxID=50452 RepID=A0A087GBG3_ARAAL|nr:hypothetical protein AALP_AA8G352400 [Arabis alpina]
MARWIRVAIVRGVRELEINRYHPEDGDSFTLPMCLFTYNKLVVLKLRRSIVLDLPLDLEVSLPSLKTLHLLSVKYENKASQRNLLAGCPVLEELVVDKTFNDPVPMFSVRVPSLKRLSIIEMDINEDSTEDDPALFNYRVLINVPSLKYLNYVDVYDFGHLCSSKNMPELVEANVKLVCKRPVKLMRFLTSVKRLSLCLYGSMLQHNIVFYQLVHLELCGCSPKWWDLLTWMLESSPKLQVLKLNNCVERSFCLVKPIEVYWRQPRSVPECLMCHLNTFEWKYYAGIHEEKELVAYILGNAKRLKTAEISALALGSEEGSRKLKELASLHRASKSCCQCVYEKLVVLKLYKAILLDFPLDLEVSLPSLKTLHLLTVKYKDEESQRRLLAGCPVLEELVVDNDWRVPSFSVIVPSLKRLSIIENDIKEDSTKEHPVYTNCRVLINVPSLKYLDYVEVYDFAHLCLSVNMPELVEANVKLVSKSPEKLMRSLTSVKRLSLCLYGSMLKHNIMFNQLVHLELCGCCPKWWDLLTWMLQSSPKLKVLKLNNCVERSFCSVKPIQGCWRQPRSVPECLMCHLNTFEWKYYSGIQEEKEMVAYILGNAKRLKTAEISALGLSSEEGPWKLKELASLHAFSTHGTYDEDEYTRFRKYVDKFMVFHKSPVLEALNLDIGIYSSYDDVATWIRIAMVRSVRELEINRYRMDDNDSFTLPTCLFTYEKLVVLKLYKNIIVDVPLDLEVPLPPLEVSLSSLKTLHLLSVQYESEQSLRRLLAGCPVLEELVVDKTYNWPVPSLSFIVPSLKRLSILDNEDEDNDGSTEERPMLPDCRVSINVPSLKYLNYVDICDFSHLCTSKHMPELVEANVRLVCKSPGNLMRSLTSVKRLSLCLYGSMLQHNIVFYQLVHLELCGCGPKWWDLLKWMLKSSPKLQVLKLNNCAERYYCDVKPIEGRWGHPQSVPECLMFHLNTFEWKYYNGEREEKKMVA